MRFKGIITLFLCHAEITWVISGIGVGPNPEGWGLIFQTD